MKPSRVQNWKRRKAKRIAIVNSENPGLRLAKCGQRMKGTIVKGWKWTDPRKDKQGEGENERGVRKKGKGGAVVPSIRTKTTNREEKEREKKVQQNKTKKPAHTDAGRSTQPAAAILDLVWLGTKLPQIGGVRAKSVVVGGEKRP